MLSKVQNVIFRHSTLKFFVAVKQLNNLTKIHTDTNIKNVQGHRLYHEYKYRSNKYFKQFDHNMMHTP